TNGHRAVRRLTTDERGSEVVVFVVGVVDQQTWRGHHQRSVFGRGEGLVMHVRWSIDDNRDRRRLADTWCRALVVRYSVGERIGTTGEAVVLRRIGKRAVGIQDDSAVCWLGDDGRSQIRMGGINVGVVLEDAIGSIDGQIGIGINAIAVVNTV